MDIALHIGSWLMLGIGGACVLTGGIGVLRMPDLYTRIHASGVTDSLGSILILGGLMLQAGFALETAKLFAILLFMLITGPTSAYALVNAALMSGMKPDAAEFDATDEDPRR